MKKPQAHIIKIFVLSLFLGFMMLDFAASLHIILKDTKKTSQVLAGDSEDSEESDADESQEQEEKAGKEDLSTFWNISEVPVLQLTSNVSFYRHFGADLLEDCHLSAPTPPPEL